MNPESMPSFTPALLLLAMLVAAAWGVKWLRQRYAIGGPLNDQAIKIVGSTSLGPQQRVVMLELTEPDGQTRHLLTVGVTPGQITALHSVPRTPAASAAITPAVRAAIEKS
jgi:flagellar biogenesis protein FliO